MSLHAGAEPVEAVDFLRIDPLRRTRSPGMSPHMMLPASSTRSTLRIGIDARKMRDFGIGTYVRGLLQGLAEIGGDEQYVVFASARDQELVPKGFEVVRVEAPNYSMQEQFVMPRAIRAATLDLYHSPHFVMPFTRCPTVATVHDVIPFRFEHANPVAAWVIAWMTSRAVHSARRVLTVSQSAKRDLVQRFHLAPERVAVTPNGIDERFFAPDEGSLPPWGRYFLYAGNDKPHKNVPRLVEAIALVRRSDRTLKLVLAGAAFQRFAGGEGVITSGFLTDADLLAAYRRAVAVVVPSLDEGFGLPAVEAMAAGAAVITSTAPALLEVTGDAALHADGRSVEDLAAAMLRVATKPAMGDELRRRGPARARQYTWRRCAELTRAAYLEAIAGELPH